MAGSGKTVLGIQAVSDENLISSKFEVKNMFNCSHELLKISYDECI